MARRSRFAFLLLLPAIAAIAVPATVGAASRTSATPRAAAEEAPKEATIQIVGLRMVPDRLEITAGTTVTWVNNEVADYPGVGGGHQIVADDGSWKSPNIAPGTRWSHRFDEPGSFGYHCTRHSATAGEIVVTGEPIVDRPVEQEVAITEDNPDDPMSWGFRPPDLVIEVGTTVIWRNNGKNVHTVSADDKSFDSGDIAPGATWRRTFDAPGAFAYHCTPHPWMKAQLRVVAPGAEAPPPPAPAEHDQHASPPKPRAASAQPERVGRGPVRHEVAIVEPDPAKPFGWTFDPATLDVKVGDTVVWRNAGSVEHSVTSDTFDSGLLKPGATWERKFGAAGVFNYHCTPHPWMKGVMRVSELDAEALPPLRLESHSTTGSGAQPQRAADAKRTGEGPVRHEALILEPDIQKAIEWKFDPTVLEARAGDTVVWRNAGTLQHTVTADNGSFDSGMIDSGKTFERRFDTPGVYAYHCTPHPWMKAVVRVSSADGGPPPDLQAVPAAPGEQAAPPPGALRIVPSGRVGPSSKFGLALVLAVFVLMVTCAAAWCWPTGEERVSLRQSFHAT
jgi:plastocyanin